MNQSGVMFDPYLDLTSDLVVFTTFMYAVPALAALATTNFGQPEIPHDILEVMVNDFIQEFKRGTLHCFLNKGSLIMTSMTILPPTSLLALNI